MLLPKRAKYRRVQRGRMKGKASRGNTVTYGEWGLATLEPTWLTGNQIEAARVAMTRYTKRGGKVWIKIFPDKPYSKALRLASHKLPVKCKIVKKETAETEKVVNEDEG